MLGLSGVLGRSCLCALKAVVANGVVGMLG